MAERIRGVRRNLGVIVLAVAFLVGAWWAWSAVGALKADNRALSQQVRQMGGVPLKSPKPGPAGERGETGQTGATGATGSRGASGATGRDGRDGRPGKDGQDGAPGSPGPAVTGPPGEKGDKGEKGDPGKDGQDGAPGPACPEGFHLEPAMVPVQGGPPREGVACVKD